MRSKSEIQKPNIYIASDLANTEGQTTALELAEAIEFNPFINKIFAVEALYDFYALDHIPEESKVTLQGIIGSELSLANILIADLRDGDPVEMGYAVAKNIPIVLFNPDKREVSPMIYGVPVLEVYDLNTLADTNFLKILLQHY